MFVIQKHAATSLHYDFRLEVDGVLASWAVPKGPSTDPRDKRLAMQVEDHPVSYGDFEGVIGPGYGAGAVIVWDTGSYDNLREGEQVAEGLERGHLSVWLHGHKLRGGYSLRRTGGGKKPRWLLVKKDDEHADPESDITQARPESVRSGRLIEELR